MRKENAARYMLHPVTNCPFKYLSTSFYIIEKCGKIAKAYIIDTLLSIYSSAKIYEINRSYLITILPYLSFHKFSNKILIIYHIKIMALKLP